jgi:hypothetical protein
VVENPVLGDGDVTQQDRGRKNKQQLKKTAHVYFLQLVGWNLNTSSDYAEVSFAPHPFRAGENFRVDINAGKNSMAAQMACIEIEKPLTFIALTG